MIGERWQCTDRAGGIWLDRADMNFIKFWLRKFLDILHRWNEKLNLKMMNLTEKEHRILKKMVKEQEQISNTSVSFIIVSLEQVLGL